MVKNRTGRILGYSKFTGKRLEAWQLVAENALGKPLPYGAQIHHIDGNIRNNSTDNLVICPSQAYHSLLHLRQDAVDAGLPPDHRKCPYCKEFDAPENMLKIQVDPQRPNGTCIHRYCRSKYLADRKVLRR